MNLVPPGFASHGRTYQDINEEVKKRVDNDVRNWLNREQKQYIADLRQGPEPPAPASAARSRDPDPDPPPSSPQLGPSRSSGRERNYSALKGQGLPAAAAPVLVADRRNGNAPVPLVEYVKRLPEREPAKDANQQRLEQRRGEMALDGIGQRMKTGRALDGEDVKNLPRRDLEQIKQQGEGHLRARVQERQQAHEQTRSMERTTGKERER